MSTIVQLVPALVLAIAAFLTAALALVYSVYPLLPPHKLWKIGINILSNNIPSPSNGAHIWIASIEVVSVSVFVWQAVMDEVESQSAIHEEPTSPASAARTWLMLSMRHTCTLLLSALAFHSVKHGFFTSWRRTHVLIWAPLLLVTLVGTVFAAVGARSQSATLPIGLIVFTFVTSIISATLLWRSRRRAICTSSPKADTETQRYPDRKWSSYSSAEVAALKEGSSWITSYTSSQRPTISAFSFSTSRTVTTSGNILTPEYQETPDIPKRALLTAPASHVGHSADPSEKSSLQKLSGGTSSSMYYTADEYGKIQSGQATPMSRAVSQSSWLTEPSVEPPTVSSWSFPTTNAADAQGQARAPPSALRGGSTRSKHNVVLPAIAAQSMDTLHMNGNFPSTDVEQVGSLEVGLLHNNKPESLPKPKARGCALIAWFAYIFTPPVFALPYLLISLTGNDLPNKAASILLIFAMTLPSFILALNIAFNPFPFPDSRTENADAEFASPSSTTFSVPPLLPTPPTRSSPDLRSTSRLHKRSGSATVSVFQVQRTDDVWLWNGDAVDGKSKLARAFSLLIPKPKLSILPSTSMEYLNDKKSSRRSEKSISPRDGDFVDRGTLNITPKRYAEYVQRASELEIHMAVSDHGHANATCGSVRSMRSLDSACHSSSHGGRDYRSLGRSQSRLAGSIVEEEVKDDQVEQQRREALALIEARASSNFQKDTSILASRELSQSKSNLLKRVSPPSPFPAMSSWRTSTSFSSPEKASIPKMTYKAHRKEGSQRRRKRSSPRLARPNKRVSFALEVKQSPRVQRSTRSRESDSRRNSVASKRRSDPAPSRIPVATSRLRQASTTSRASETTNIPAPTAQPHTPHEVPSHIPRRIPSSIPKFRHQATMKTTAPTRIWSVSSGTSMSSFERGMPLAESTPPPTLGMAGRGNASTK